MKRNKLPKWLVTVTWFTKLLALSLYIILPFLGFYYGRIYERKYAISPISGTRLQECPDAWFVSESKKSGDLREHYMIFDGKKIDAVDVDTLWVVANCEIKKPEILF